jgi:hypothetical protein
MRQFEARGSLPVLLIGNMRSGPSGGASSVCQVKLGMGNGGVDRQARAGQENRRSSRSHLEEAHGELLLSIREEILPGD